MKQIDLTGQKFGRWSVQRVSHRHNRQIYWLCRCECGVEKAIVGGALTRSTIPSRSCGCLKTDVARKRATIHGEATTGHQSAEWWILQRIKYRCLNPNTKNYADYGGRGITVCQEWLQGNDIHSGYELFLVHVGRRPSSQHQIERIDNSKGYEPGNVKWATRHEQARNRRSNVWVKVENIPMVVTDALANIPNGSTCFSKIRKQHPNASPQRVVEFILNQHRAASELT